MFSQSTNSQATASQSAANQPTASDASSAHQIVLITGGSRGLGKNAALQLAAAGYDLILTYQHSALAAEEVANAARELGRRAVALPLDLADSSQIAPFIDTLRQTLQQRWPASPQSLYAVVNNAGIGIHQAYADTSEAQLDQLFNLHVKGPYLLTQQLIPLLGQGSRVLNLSTGLTRFAIPGYSAYAMMKGAVETMSLYQAKELAPLGIRVNVLAPGAIETDFGGGAVRDNEQINQYLASQTALGRVGQPDDIGRMIRLLLSADSHWMTAQRVEASGGMFL